MQMRINRSQFRNYPLRSRKGRYSSMKDIREALFPNRKFCDTPKESELKYSDLENQLNNEIKQDQEISCLSKRLEKPKNLRIDFKKKIEQESVETLNQWELEKVNNNEAAEYGSRIYKLVEDYIVGNSETMLNKDWVKINDLLREPVQIIHALRNRRTNGCFGLFSETPKNLPSINSNIAFDDRIMSPRMKLTKSLFKENDGVSFSGRFSPTPSIINYQQDDKWMILNNEINMELLSLSLKRLIISKKNKQCDLRIENMALLNNIKHIDGLSSM